MTPVPNTEIGSSAQNELNGCYEFQAKGKNSIQLIGSKQFDLSQPQIKRTRQGANPNLAQTLRKNFIMNFKPISLNMGVL